MRICHVIATVTEWGGMERCVVDLANLQSATHTVGVIGAPLVLDQLSPAVQKICLPMQRSRRNPLLLWELRRALISFQPDIVHAHAGKAAGLVSALRFFPPRLCRVASVHGTKKPLNFLKHFDRVIAVSDRAGKCHPGVRYSVVWNGIKAVPDHPRPTDLSAFPFLGQGKPVIATVGRLVEEKGFDVLLDAMREVDAFLWIIGDGPLEAELQARCHQHGLDQRVWFAGFRKDVSLLMRLADLMVISSRREGFPLVLAEMLQLQRPVVSTRVAGVEEILPAEWMCEPENAAGLAALIKKALGLLPQLSQEFAPIFKLAAEELRIESAARKTEAIYREARQEVDRH